MLSRIKKNDTVCVISGKDRGKQGQVISVDEKKKRIIVKGAGIITRHVKPRRRGEQGGIKKEESFISVDKVMPICSSCKKACRVQVKAREGKKKARIGCRCKEVL
jgi:large subunit ribosomal protein L24